MTGFARQSAETAAGTMTWELRAVNQRFLEVQFRLPEELRPNEQAFKQRVAAVLRRGKVDCALHFNRAFSQQDALKLNPDMVDLLRTRVTEIQNVMPNATSPGALDILRWPGVIADSEVDAEPLAADAEKLLDSTLQAMVEMRRSEGARIREMLETRCEDIGAIAATVRKRLPDVLAAAHAKQRERIDKLDVQADPARLEVELALIAQKLDVDEELDRLESHVTEIREVLNNDDAVGRRLDFLMQELNREANTLDSKSDEAVTRRPPRPRSSSRC